MKQAPVNIKNKRATFDYELVDTYTAGIVLTGTEIKSIRMGKCSIKEAFIKIESDGQVYVFGMHISPYEKGNIFNKDPLRVRKLLLHKKEILKIFGKMKEQGIPVVPLQVYFITALIYFIICFPLSNYVKKLERRKSL